MWKSQSKEDSGRNFVEKLKKNTGRKNFKDGHVCVSEGRREFKCCAEMRPG